jgi:hypothetical protein
LVTRSVKIDRINLEEPPARAVGTGDESMMKKLMLGAAALALVAGVFTVSTQRAQARGGFGPGLAVGTILGLGIARAYAGPPYYYYGPGCYPGPRRCGYVHRSCWFNRWGERICDGGGYRCWRARICD